ncbi:hypothetical protein [Streptomyces sp. NPDC097619]|uniref:hypothetical protein n=1 Tax=Streptomyces sp. NPDC097619 TaxID=3157228 RepID=UPI003319FB85
MMFTVGQRVELAVELGLGLPVTVAGGADAGAGPDVGGGAGADAATRGDRYGGGRGDRVFPGAVVGSLGLAAGTRGTVERVDSHERQPDGAVREYLRLRSLLDDFGPQMPAASRARLAEEVAELEPGWRAFEAERLRVTVRVRLDNGFLVEGTDPAALRATADPETRPSAG